MTEQLGHSPHRVVSVMLPLNVQLATSEHSSIAHKPHYMPVVLECSHATERWLRSDVISFFFIFAVFTISQSLLVISYPLHFTFSF